MLREVSRRGTYYNLEKSPFVVESPYGDSFKFSSEKKRAIFNREIAEAMGFLAYYWKTSGIEKWLPDQIKKATLKALYHCVYNNGKVR